MEHIYQNMHILPKMSHLTSRGAYVWTYLLVGWYFFEELFICFNFSMTFVMIFLDCGGQISDFL